MIIYNNSSQIQELSVIDRGNNELTYSIYVSAKDYLELDRGLVVMNLKSLVDRDIIRVVDTPEVEETPVVETPVVIEEIPVVEETPAEIVEEVSPEVLEEDVTEVVTSDAEEKTQFICEICGKEFASERSLNMHMSRSHKE